MYGPIVDRSSPGMSEPKVPTEQFAPPGGVCVSVGEGSPTTADDEQAVACCHQCVALPKTLSRIVTVASSGLHSIFMSRVSYVT